MFKIVKSLFGGTAVPAQASAQRHTHGEKGAGIEDFFQSEVENSIYLKSEGKQAVLDHLSGKIDILKSSNVLSLEDKRSLGINTRLKITRELVAVLNDAGLNLDHPAAVITEMWVRATLRKSRHDKLERLRSGNIFKKFKLMSCGDGNDCLWCKEMQTREFDVQFEIESAISSNCRCAQHCKCIIQPIIEF